MPSKAEGKYAGEFLASVANGQQSFDVGTLTLSATVYQPGDVLGLVASTGKYVLVNYAATDGSEVARAINYARQDASSADQTKCPFVARDCEVNQSELNFNTSDAPTIANIIADLAARNIIVRTGV